jgi:4-amino-4-deoxy-L-arabinose transferase-like glycosyltransferase
MTDKRSALLSDILCILAVLAVCFTGIAGHDLWSPDEPREAAISQEMANSGQLIIPTLGGIPFVEKPPLYYIATSGMIKVLGPWIGNTVSIRMTTALFGIGVLIVTYLLGFRIGGRQTGILSAVILGTMEGFAENFHWIRVDAGLSFFVIAAVYCFYEMYREERYEMAVPAGISLAGAFLCKGPIGPVLSFVPWFILFAMRLYNARSKPLPLLRFILSHLFLLLLFAGLSGLWVVLFYQKSDPVLWKEWFWVNQVGRLTGEAVTKGHIKRGEPFYYVIQLLAYGIPWSPLIFFWFGAVTHKAITEKRIDEKDLFLYFWGIVSIVVLTFSATKRGIYMQPFLSVYAIVSALALEKGLPKWFKPYAVFWVSLCIVLITLVTFMPFFSGFLFKVIPLKHPLPPSVLEELSDFGYYNVISLAGLAACLALIFKYRGSFSNVSLLVLVTAVFYVTLLGTPMKAIDRVKGMGEDYRQFVSKIPSDKMGRTAGFDFTETNQGCFSYYCGVRFPMIMDKTGIENVLKGNDPGYDCVILKKRSRTGDETGLADAPYKVIAKTVVGYDTSIFCIEGVKPH